MTETRNKLRQLKVLQGNPPIFNLESSPESPIDLFLEWLDVAILTQVPEPHAMTLSTVDELGFPDARVLILKNVDANGWYFATSGSSTKGKQIENNPSVALTFYWKSLSRQVRIRGAAIKQDISTNQHDFLSRPKTSRALALMNKQSQVLSNSSDVKREYELQCSNLDKTPDLIAYDWSVYCVTPRTVEFWQGHPERKHLRLLYIQEDNSFNKAMLWP